MKRNATRILTLVLAIALIMSMSLTAFALDSNVWYMSPAPGTEYTTMVSASTTSVSLEVFFSACDSVTGDWYNVGFDENTSATWTVKADPDNLISGNITVTATKEGTLDTCTGTVPLYGNKAGVAIVTAAYGTYTLDLVIAVDREQTASAVTADVYLIDASAGGDGLLDYKEAVTVTAPGTLTYGKSGAFQKQPTAMNVLDSLNSDHTIVLSATGEYVTEIDDLQYWSYAAYDASGNIVSISQNISAAICVLPTNGYTVVWKYGSYSFANTLSSEVGPWIDE